MGEAKKILDVIKDVRGQIRGSSFRKFCFSLGVMSHYALKKLKINVTNIPEVIIEKEGVLFATRKNTVDFWMVWKNYEKDNFDKIKFLNPTKFVFVDVGANIGAYSVSLAKKGFETYSFEPIKSNFDLLNKNLRLNDIKNAKTFNLAIGNETAKKEIFFDDHKHGEGSLLIKKGNRKEVVQVDKLDNLFKGKNLKKKILLKVDVEGFEFEVLKGAKNFIKKYRPIILIEVWNEDTKKFLLENKYSPDGEFWYPK